MKAYLVGGPEDMVVVAVQPRISRLCFPHVTALEPPSSMPPTEDFIPVKQVFYNKVYESHGRFHFAIFVHDPV